jgi:hypothetical protein
MGGSNKENLHSFLAGGIAGPVAKTATAPLSRVTILFQVHSLVSSTPNDVFAGNTRQAFMKVIEREGFLSFWKGNGVSVIHRFPYSAINFVCFENFQEIFAQVFLTHSVLLYCSISY